MLYIHSRQAVMTHLKTKFKHFYFQIATGVDWKGP